MLVPSRNALFFVSNRSLRNTSQYGVCSLLDLGSGVTEDLTLDLSKCTSGTGFFNRLM